MDLTHRFRRTMLRRLLDAAGLAILAAPAFYGVACGGKVVVDESSGGNGGGGSGGNGGEGGSSSSWDGGNGSPATSTGSGCALTSSGVTGGANGPQIQVTECIPMMNNTCPNQYEATKFIVPSMSCSYVVSVDCGPVSSVNVCCYLVTEEGGGCIGRPFLIDDEQLTARALEGDHGWSLGVLAPSVEGMDPALRAALGSAWTTDALLEHASVASFSRFALELLAAGAPADLVKAAHEAALDEVRHARICFALAQGYRGAPVGPAPFPFGGAVAISSDLAAITASVAREGCIGETLSSVLAAEQLARATDPAVRRALSAIAEDEARHAELAWRTVAWALEHGGAEVHAAVEAVFAEAERWIPRVSPILPGAEAHGRLDVPTAREAMARALAEIIYPCSAALLQKIASSEGVASAAA